jgi:hypothetical protein
MSPQMDTIEGPVPESPYIMMGEIELARGVIVRRSGRLGPSHLGVTAWSLQAPGPSPRTQPLYSWGSSTSSQAVLAQQSPECQWASYLSRYSQRLGLQVEGSEGGK